MLMISEKELREEAKNKGYRAEILEKVYCLLQLSERFMSVDYLKKRLVLKGGTAINLFCTDKLPRLSVDLDFNYIGSLDRNVMRQEKEIVEKIIIDVCRQENYSLHRHPHKHAGGKMVFVYESLLGHKGRLEIDLNYIFRAPLWKVESRFSAEWPMKTEMPVLDIHELAAGKLHALLGREASRDLFDSHQLLTNWPLDTEKLRLAFTVYAGMEQDDWRRVAVNNVQFTVKDIQERLVPVLRKDYAPSTKPSKIDQWAKQLVDECCASLGKVLPFRKNEIEFLEAIQQQGILKPELLSDDQDFCGQVLRHPALLWRCQQKAKISEN